MAQYYVFLFLSPLSFLLLAVALFWAFRFKSSDCGGYLIWNLLTVAGYLTLNALELLSKSPVNTMLFARHNFIFISLTPVTWFCFSLCYCGFKRMLRPGIIWMYFLVPAVTIFLAMSGIKYSILWKNYALLQKGPFLLLNVQYGVWFWIHAAYSYGLVIAGSILIGRQFFMAGTMYSRRSVLMIIGALVPVFVNFLFALRIIPGFDKDFTPISFALSGFLYVVGMYRYHLLDIMPVAHQALLDQLDDGILVLDRGNRIVEVNPKAGMICDLSREDVGTPYDTIPLVKQIVENFHAGEKESQIKLNRNEKDHYYLVRTVTIPGRRAGIFAYIITFRPITELVVTINQLKEALKEIKTL